VEEVFGEEKSGAQLVVVAGGSHRHADGAIVHANLERFFRGKFVALGRSGCDRRRATARRVGRGRCRSRVGLFAEAGPLGAAVPAVGELMFDALAAVRAGPGGG
jgi:hypothetical protein